LLAKKIIKKILNNISNINIDINYRALHK